MSKVSQRVANQTKGGFLDDVDATIVSAKFAKSSFEGSDGETVNKTQAVIEYEIEGREEPVPVFYSIGNADNIAPFEDEECEIEVDDDGQFLGGHDGKEIKGVNEQSAWGKFQAALVAKCKFPDKDLDLAVSEALVGLSGHLTNLPGGKYKGQQGRAIVVFASIDKDTIPSASGTGKKAGKKVAKPAPGKVTSKKKDADEEEAEAPTKVKAKKAPVEEEADDDSDDIDAQVSESIQKAIKKGPLPKGQLAQRVGKLHEGAENKAEYVKLAMSDKFLKAGAEAGLWSYDGRMVSVFEAEEADDDDTE